MIKKLKRKFHYRGKAIFLGDLDIYKVFVSNKASFSEDNYKYFIGYKIDHCV